MLKSAAFIFSKGGTEVEGFFEEVDLGFTFDVGSEDDRGLEDFKIIQPNVTSFHMRREDEKTPISSLQQKLKRKPFFSPTKTQLTVTS